MNFAVPADHRIKLKESERKHKYLDRELKKIMGHESDGYINCNWCSWCCHQRIGKMNRGLGNKRTSGDNRNYNIVEIGQNTRKSPGNIRRLIVTQNPMKHHQLCEKNLKES